MSSGDKPHYGGRFIISVFAGQRVTCLDFVAATYCSVESASISPRRPLVVSMHHSSCDLSLI